MKLKEVFFSMVRLTLLVLVVYFFGILIQHQFGTFGFIVFCLVVLCSILRFIVLLDKPEMEHETPVYDRNAPINNINTTNHNHIYGPGIIGTNSGIFSNGSEGVQQLINQNNQAFEDLLNAIKSSDIEIKAQLVAAVEDMKQESKSGSISTFSYNDFMGSIANHMAVLGPLTTFLKQFVSN
jgi:hypothetical protein